jgi:hypothetical protein
MSFSAGRHRVWGKSMYTWQKKMPNVVLFLFRKVQFRHGPRCFVSEVVPDSGCLVANQGDDYKISGPVEYLEIYVTASCRGLTIVLSRPERGVKEAGMTRPCMHLFWGTHLFFLSFFCNLQLSVHWYGMGIVSGTSRASCNASQWFVGHLPLLRLSAGSTRRRRGPLSHAASALWPTVHT